MLLRSPSPGIEDVRAVRPHENSESGPKDDLVDVELRYVGLRPWLAMSSELRTFSLTNSETILNYEQDT
jgi:hypothetical protein